MIKSSGGDIPLRILKGNKIFPQVLCKWISNSLKTGDFPDPLKLAEITTIHEEEDQFDKDNYRSIGVLPLISRVFEKITLANTIFRVGKAKTVFRQFWGADYEYHIYFLIYISYKIFAFF